MIRFLPALALALLAGCSGLQEPAQPTVASTNANLAAVASLNVCGVDGKQPCAPQQVWEVNSWATQMACDAALDAGSRKNNNLTLASTAAAFAGPAAAAFGAGPLAPLASSTAAGLFGLLQSTGVQYTAADTVLVRGTMSAYRQSVAAAPPLTIPQAMMDSEQHWYLCSVAGQAEAQELSKMSAQPVPTGTASPNFRALGMMPSEPGVSIGGHRI